MWIMNSKTFLYFEEYIFGKLIILRFEKSKSNADLFLNILQKLYYPFNAYLLKAGILNNIMDIE